jgi:hypothetical protein
MRIISRGSAESSSLARRDFQRPPRLGRSSPAVDVQILSLSLSLSLSLRVESEIEHPTRMIPSRKFAGAIAASGVKTRAKRSKTPRCSRARVRACAEFRVSKFASRARLGAELYANAARRLYNINGSPDSRRRFPTIVRGRAFAAQIPPANDGGAKSRVRAIRADRFARSATTAPTSGLAACIIRASMHRMYATRPEKPAWITIGSDRTRRVHLAWRARISVGRETHRGLLVAHVATHPNYIHPRFRILRLPPPFQSGGYTGT